MRQRPDNTFAIERPGDFLQKAKWELNRLEGMLPVDQPGYFYQVIDTLSDCWHMVDWVHGAMSETQRADYGDLSAFKNRVRQECRSLAICREVADAIKHFGVDRRRDEAVATRFMLGAGAINEAETTWLIVDGENLLDPRLVAKAGLAYWEDLVACLGIKDATPVESLYDRSRSVL